MELFTAIKDALVARLRRLPWMDEETRKKAQDRVWPGQTDRQGGDVQGAELSIGSRGPSGGQCKGGRTRGRRKLQYGALVPWRQYDRRRQGREQEEGPLADLGFFRLASLPRSPNCR